MAHKSIVTAGILIRQNKIYFFKTVIRKTVVKQKVIKPLHKKGEQESVVVKGGRDSCSHEIVMKQVYLSLFLPLSVRINKPGIRRKRYWLLFSM